MVQGLEESERGCHHPPVEWKPRPKMGLGIAPWQHGQEMKWRKQLKPNEIVNEASGPLRQPMTEP